MKHRRIDTNAFIIHMTAVGASRYYLNISMKKCVENLRQNCIQLYTDLAKILSDENLQIVHERLFGDADSREIVLSARKKIWQALGVYDELPLTYIQSKPADGEGFAGLQLCAARPDADNRIWTIYDDGKARGRGWKDHSATFLLIQNIHGRQNAAAGDNNYGNEAARMFEHADAVLRTQGAAYHDVVRTWIYIPEILEWYDEFNAVRNAKYAKFGFIPDSMTESSFEQIPLPASTGIQGGNPIGVSVLMDLFAVIREPSSSLEIIHVTGHEQKSAYRYGSAFSRAVSIEDAHARQIMVSGTASIDDLGKTVFQGDSRAQIQKTLQVTQSLLEQQGASLRDLCDATVFVKKPEDIAEFRKVAAEFGLEQIPAVCVVADVCRDDLLFEMDAIAAVEK